MNKLTIILTALLMTLNIQGASALVMMPPAEEKTGIEIERVYAYPTPQSRPAAAVFLTAHNHDAVDDAMTGFTVEGANRTELHTMEMNNDIMRMRKVDAYRIKGNNTLSLIPMGDHIMVFDHGSDWAVGDEIQATAIFENAGPVPVTIKIIERGESLDATHDDHMDHDHH